MKTFRLKSTEVFGVPGLLAWAINGYAFRKDRDFMLDAMTQTFPQLSRDVWGKILSREIPHRQEGNDILIDLPDDTEEPNRLEELQDRVKELNERLRLIDEVFTDISFYLSEQEKKNPLAELMSRIARNDDTGFSPAQIRKVVKHAFHPNHPVHQYIKG